MFKWKGFGRKVTAYLLTMCMAVGLLTGISLYTSSTEVSAAAGFTQNDFLKCDGTSIRNNYGRGNNVYLRGTNIGNLFVQESWMSSTNATDQKTILNALTSRFGQNRALELLDYYESNYFTEADIDRCAAMGMSVIRVPFTYMNLYKQSGSSWVLRSDAFDRLDWIVQECSERGIYVILDLHGAFGSQNGQDHSGEVINNVSDVSFFYNETLMSQTLELWRVVAQHYAGNPAVAAYDTLNEPGEKAGTTSERHWNFYDRMYDTIRSVDSDHIVIMESCWGVSNLPSPSRYGWTNVVYEYHHYPWDYVSDTDANYTGQVNAINNLISSVNNANYGVPTFIGEFNCFDGDAKWQYVLNAMNDAGWHYTNWSYKSRGMGSWGIYHELGTEKVNPWSTSESDILRIWGSSSIGTNAGDTGVTYNNMRQYLPGTVVMADKALTDSDYVAIKANINNKYVCAEDYGEGALIADRASSGGWEQFRLIGNSDGTVSLQSRANNKYLCAVFDDTDTENPIVARSNSIGTWEKFYLEKQSDGTYALKTYVNNYYVQADINDTNSGKLHAYGTSVGTWERFTLEAVSGTLVIPGESTSTGGTTTETPTTGGTTDTAAIQIPGTIEINSYSAKTDAITFTTENGVTYAGGLNDGSYLDYKVNVASAGNYKVTLKLAAGDSQWNANSMLVKVDGNTAATVAVTGSSSWTTFVNHTATVNMSAGTHTLSIQAVGGACNVADIVVEKVTSSSGSSSSSGSTSTSGNLAKGKTVTYSGTENDSFPASNAVDGNTGTRWSSNWADNAWITVDLGNTYSVNKVVLNWEGAYGTAYNIQISTNGSNWTTVKSLTGQDGGTDTIEFTATNARYVRMQGVTRALPYGYSLYEMEVYGGAATSNSGSSSGSDSNSSGSSSGATASGNIASGKTVTASGAEADGTAAKYAVDGDAGTRWSSNFADDAWITVDLGATYAVNKVVLNWEGAYGTAYKILVSTDGYNWTTVSNLTGQNGGIDEISFNATNARYVKMQGVTRALPYGYSLYEMEVYATGSSSSSSSTYGNVSTGKTATASGAESDSFAASKAVDGDAGTRWSSNFADNAWITVDLGSTYAVNKVEISWEGAYATAYKILVSTDGYNWTTVSNLTGQNGGDDTVTFTETNARYVRMQGVTRALPYGYSIWEMNVYGK